MGPVVGVGVEARIVVLQTARVFINESGEQELEISVDPSDRHWGAGPMVLAGVEGALGRVRGRLAVADRMSLGFYGGDATHDYTSFLDLFISL
jgi:hypothetical protein